MTDEIETKLSAARTRLILDRPFLGALTLRLPLVEADSKWCKTTATDARALYFNRDYIASLTSRETEFVLAHEALHCALTHFARRQHRLKHRWDVACDLAINPILLAEGLTPPPNALVMPGFEDLSAEEIYPLLDDDPEQEPHDQHVYDDDTGDGGQGGDVGRDRPRPSHPEKGRDASAGGSAESAGAAQPPPLATNERDALAVQWQQRLAGAAQQAQQAGKLGGAMARLVDHLLQPQLPWRVLLAQHLALWARDDYSYLRPSRREGAAILPSLRSHGIELVVAIDSSGSIKHEELEEFLAEVNALKGQLRARITLLACDNAIAPGAPWVCEAWEELRLPHDIGGGGGTSFVPVFDWIAHQDRPPDLLVYFTDALGEFPLVEPPHGVLWLVKGKGRVPWGQRIQLN